MEWQSNDFNRLYNGDRLNSLAIEENFQGNWSNSPLALDRGSEKLVDNSTRIRPGILFTGLGVSHNRIAESFHE